MMRGFPWDQAMAFGLGTLRLPPPVFWSLTPRELAALSGIQSGGGAPSRESFERLRERFPDADGRTER